MQVQVNKHMNIRAVSRFVSLFLVLIAVFSCAGRLTAANYQPLPVVDDLPSEQVMVCQAPTDLTKEECSTYVSHPRKSHHIVRRRVSVQGFVRDALVSSDEDKLITNIARRELASFSSQALASPFYYIFLFRYAVF